MILNAKNASKFIIRSEFTKNSPLGIDLTIKSLKQIMSGNIITKKATVIYPSTYVDIELTPDENPENSGIFSLNPGVYALTFNEGLIKLPPTIHATIRHRSSLLRIGGEITSGIFEPGYEVENIGATMIVHNIIHIEKNSRIAQILFQENQEAEEYISQWHKDKDFK